MAGTERLSSEELAAALAAGACSEFATGVSPHEQPDELHGGRSDRLSGAELLGAHVLGFLHRRRLPLGIGLVAALGVILCGGWYVLVRMPPIDPVIHARIRYVSTYRELSVVAPTGAVAATSLRTTLRITSDDPQSQVQITGIAVTDKGLPPIQVTQDGASIILITPITCPITVPATVDLRLRVVRFDRWGRSLAAELPILPGVGGDLLSGHGAWVPQPTDPGVNPVVDMINHYCVGADPNAYKSSLWIGPAPSH
jgi:hypothetical protein